MVPKLKITAIKPYPVWVGIRNQLIIKVETDQGIYGWGESGLSSREKAVVGAIEHCAEFLRGRTMSGLIPMSVHGEMKRNPVPREAFSERRP